jgi:hypothetical protein
MTVDRTPKPCPHPRANHQHGTFLAYDKDDCRCWPCLAANSAQGRAERYRTATGTHTYVPADPARTHIQQLLETLTVGQIEQRSGVHRTAIRVLIGDFPGRPASKRITRTTERALLAVEADRVGTEQHGWVDGTGTRRRFRALIALGWPARTLGDRLGFSSRTNWFLTCPDIDDAAPIRASTRTAVRRLYDELSLTKPAPARQVTRARGIATARRWAPPLAWDDDTIDDPAAAPDLGDQVDDVDEFAVEQVLAGERMTLTGATLHAAVHALAAAGHQPQAIAERLGIQVQQAHRLRGRQDPPRPKRREAA